MVVAPSASPAGLPPFLVAAVVRSGGGGGGRRGGREPPSPPTPGAALREWRRVCRAWLRDCEPLVWAYMRPRSARDLAVFFSAATFAADDSDYDEDQVASAQVDDCNYLALPPPQAPSTKVPGTTLLQRSQLSAAVRRRALFVRAIDLRALCHSWELDIDDVWPQLNVLLQLATNLERLDLPFAAFSRAPYYLYKTLCLHGRCITRFDSPLPAVLVYAMKRLAGIPVTVHNNRSSARSRRSAAVDVAALLSITFPSLHTFNALGLAAGKIPNVHTITCVTAPVALDMLRASSTRFSRLGRLEVVCGTAAFEVYADAAGNSALHPLAPNPNITHLAIRADATTTAFSDAGLDGALRHAPNLRALLCSARDRAVLTESTATCIAARCPRLHTFAATLCEASLRPLRLLPPTLVHLSLDDVFVETFAATDIPDEIWARLRSFSLRLDPGEDSTDEDDHPDGENGDDDASSGWSLLVDLLPRLTSVEILGIPPLQLRAPATEYSGDTLPATTTSSATTTTSTTSTTLANATTGGQPAPTTTAAAPAAAATVVVPQPQRPQPAPHRNHHRRRREPAFRRAALDLAVASCPRLRWLRLLDYAACRDSDTDECMLSPADWDGFLACNARPGSVAAANAAATPGERPALPGALRVVEWDAPESWAAERRALELDAARAGMAFAPPPGWVWPWDLAAGGPDYSRD